VEFRSAESDQWRLLRTLSGSRLVRLTGNRTSWIGELTQ
jgi:hypothetical protein